MRLSILTLLAASLIPTLPAAFADDHPPARITGAGIDLYEFDHSFAGQIAGHTAFGAFDHEPFGAAVQFRRGDKTHTLALIDGEKTYSGQVSESVTDSSTGETRKIETSVEFVKIQKTGDTQALLTLKIDGQEVAVTILGKKFEAGHFHDSVFTATIAGETRSFAFTGVSCFGYSTNIAMMVFGTQAHLLKK